MVLVGLGALLWLFLTGMPFGGAEPSPERPKVETVAEAPPTGQSATIVDVTPGDVEDVPASTVIEPNIAAEDPAAEDPAPVTRTAEPPKRTVATPAPRPPATRPPASEISAGEAEAILRNYVTSANYYNLRSECLRINNRGYRNVGYTLDIWDTCHPGGGSRMLGSWRVDAKTREVFRRRDDGRYLKP